MENLSFDERKDLIDVVGKAYDIEVQKTFDYTLKVRNQAIEAATNSETLSLLSNLAIASRSSEISSSNANFFLKTYGGDNNLSEHYKNETVRTVQSIVLADRLAANEKLYVENAFFEKSHQQKSTYQTLNFCAHDLVHNNNDMRNKRNMTVFVLSELAQGNGFVEKNLSEYIHHSRGIGKDDVSGATDFIRRLTEDGDFSRTARSFGLQERSSSDFKNDSLSGISKNPKILVDQYREELQKLSLSSFSNSVPGKPNSYVLALSKAADDYVKINSHSQPLGGSQSIEQAVKYMLDKVRLDKTPGSLEVLANEYREFNNNQARLELNKQRSDIFKPFESKVFERIPDHKNQILSYSSKSNSIANSVLHRMKALDVKTLNAFEILPKSLRLNVMVRIEEDRRSLEKKSLNISPKKQSFSLAD